MGMYNYIGTSGDQVKCFYVPCISVSPTNTVCMGSSGGRLECVNDTPYMTPYYNYGKDFGIMTFALAFTPLEVEVHIVRDGKWVETLPAMQMDDNYDLPPVIINNFGTFFNVHSVAELKQMLQEFHDANVEHDRILFDGLEAHNLKGRFPTIAEFKNKPHEERVAELAIRSEIGDLAYKTTQKIVNEKWVIHDPDADMAELVGLVYADWRQQNPLDESITPAWQRPEEEWTIIVDDLYDRFNDIGDPLAFYKNWCNKKGIIVDINDVSHFLNTYKTKR